MGVIGSQPHFNFIQQRIATKSSLLNVAESKFVETSRHASLEPSSSNSLPTISPFSKISRINLVKASHAQIIKLPNKKDSHVKVQSLITSYLELGDFQSAAMVFFLGFSGNYLCWNSFLEDFRSFGGDPFEILEVFASLHNMGVEFGSENLAIVLKLCGNLMGSLLGLQVHVWLIKKGLDLDVYLKCALMNFYGRCWDLDITNNVFDEMSHESDHSSLLWNEALLVNLRNEKWSEGLEIFRKMQFLPLSGNKNSFTIAKVLQACGKVEALDEGKQIHGYIIRHRLESNTFICNSLINMYIKNGNLQLARKVFDAMENRNVSTWNSIITGYMGFGFLEDSWKLFHGMRDFNLQPDIVTWNTLLSGNLSCRSYQEVLIILQQMQNANMEPDARSITTALQAVSELSYLNLGKSIHSYVVRKGLDSDLHLQTSLLDMYVKNDDLNSAQAVFDGMKDRNIFAWNAMVSGYCFKGNFVKALALLNQMKREGVEPDLVTYNSMISGYSTAGRIDEALDIFDEIKASGSNLTPNVVSWTALISGCSQKGNYENALGFFQRMQNEGVRPNAATIASLLRACAGLSSLHKGKEAHCLSIKNRYIEDTFVCTAVTDMYSKCGDVKSAYNVFRKVEAKTLASWNSMIMGFSTNGYGEQALSLFQRMQETGLKPDAITMTAVLTGCKNSGFLDEGWRFFDSMETEYGITPTIQHYSCMVDLLGRCGYIDEAWDLIENMPVEPDATVWGSFLGSCRIHDQNNNIQLAEIAARELFKLEPNNPANYVLLMNIYAAAGRWNDVDKVKDFMHRRSVKLGTVWSWIEIDNRVHVFSVDGNGNPHVDGEVYFELYKIISEIKKTGYIPDTRCVYQNVVEEEKEKALLSHTEKKAIAFGLIKLKRDDKAIRVIKNTRICADCHSFAKYVSLVRKRLIVVKDGVRFHHFRYGVCSCKDFW